MWIVLTGQHSGMDDTAVGMSGEQRKANLSEVARSVDYLKRNVFPMHGIE